MESFLTIEQVARQTGLTAHTLRYYERIGLIAPVARASGGQRRYAARDMAWIEFLLRLRTTHMPIGTMQTFAALRGAGDGTVTQRREMLEVHLDEVRAGIAAMQQSAQALQEKIEHYRALEQSLAPSLPDDRGHPDANERTLRTRPGEAA